MPFPVQSTLSWTKVARDVAGILRGRAFQLLYSCKQVHKQFCQGWGRNTNARSCDCLAFGVSMNDNNLPEEDSENTNLPVLLRDDTICGVDVIVRVRREE